MANHSFVYHINITTIAHLKYFGNSIETTIQYFGVNVLAYEKSELISKMTDKGRFICWRPCPEALLDS